MGNDSSGERSEFLEWLDESVESEPEAKLAAREEEVRLYLASALRRARNEAGLTQAQVAEASGLRQSVVSRLESSDHNPTIETILRYLSAVGANLVMSVTVGDEVLNATALAERSVLLPEAAAREAKVRGISLSEYVLSSLAAGAQSSYSS